MGLFGRLTKSRDRALRSLHNLLVKLLFFSCKSFCVNCVCAIINCAIINKLDRMQNLAANKLVKILEHCNILLEKKNQI